MNVWDGVCMCCIYASLLEFVLVNYVGRKRSDWPLPIVYQNKDQDYKQITQVRKYILLYNTVCIYTAYILYSFICRTQEHFDLLTFVKLLYVSIIFKVV